MAEEKTTNPKSEARSAAARRLRDAHAEEYNGYLGEEMAARGIEWTPRLTDEQKAAKQVSDLLTQYPGLAATFAVTAWTEPGD